MLPASLDKHPHFLSGSQGNDVHAEQETGSPALSLGLATLRTAESLQDSQGDAWFLIFPLQ